MGLLKFLNENKDVILTKSSPYIYAWIIIR